MAATPSTDPKAIGIPGIRRRLRVCRSLNPNSQPMRWFKEGNDLAVLRDQIHHHILIPTFGLAVPDQDLPPEFGEWDQLYRDICDAVDIPEGEADSVREEAVRTLFRGTEIEEDYVN